MENLLKKTYEFDCAFARLGFYTLADRMWIFLDLLFDIEEIYRKEINRLEVGITAFKKLRRISIWENNNYYRGYGNLYHIVVKYNHNVSSCHCNIYLGIKPKCIGTIKLLNC